jgi:hypothetical protein
MVVVNFEIVGRRCWLLVGGVESVLRAPFAPVRTWSVWIQNSRFRKSVATHRDDDADCRSRADGPCEK